MRVSIITPAYNCAHFIDKCVSSVKNQTYKDIEHVIINDGSKDNTFETAKKYEKEYNLKLLTQDNHGIAYSMTRGFKEASGDIFAWIDADNYYDTEIIDEVIKIFEKDSSIDIAYGNIDNVDESGKMIFTYKPPHDISFEKALIYTTGAIPQQPAVFFKRKIFEKIGSFDSKYKIAGDYDFWLKALIDKPKLFYYDKSFGYYLRVRSGISQNARGTIRGYKEMLDVCKKYKQPLYGKIMMFIKYAKGYLGSFIKR